ncbi:phosphonate ABC transporter ATP-binding protein [Mycoplasma mycoides subsp. mycoides]|uniref:Phosphonates import ATP-binding protein PhnC n=2 Tax=Mycoplasma mycoides subsp. mycoides TaxID=2103 RepID=PHNC_MYCMS|nr:phosphonate ABC transporter ATP-binding protein [Mycoplasma mycoides]Q6MUF4.1 RecName: Full=Phosphonates import ATP-binding protein PhnC [Mycoplasma mycoides subsp. mycoides SC str. PG1]ADK69492.1 phosphonate ABC transporter, ATP-binding protein [Mycoplasma mycoides subsp. mycoides SC str. Gladysdale]AIZ54910.1 ABC transporter ATP-binding protein [Mycoplasma mycoides subsp. mycoides]AME10285.1 phosphonate ABC transporter ATP-binding protein [Mycoplasma mycoides subsp. mycoides]AME11290.1 ph
MIVFNNVNKVWPNGKQVLKNINLEINKGELVAVIGLSGAGKTTLLKTINKINDISSGEILIDFDKTKEHYEVTKTRGKKLQKLRQKIGLMSQEYNNIANKTVLQNVLNARVSSQKGINKILGFFKREDKMIALNSLDKLNLLDYAYIRADNLSGGQQQRVALARTLAQQPFLIIADEPVSALDPILANQVMKDFKNINKKDGITVIINIHHVDLAKKYATRVIGLNNGEIVFDDVPSKLDAQAMKKIYGE